MPDNGSTNPTAVRLQYFAKIEEGFVNEGVIAFPGHPQSFSYTYFDSMASLRIDPPSGVMGTRRLSKCTYKPENSACSDGYAFIDADEALGTDAFCIQ